MYAPFVAAKRVHPKATAPARMEELLPLIDALGGRERTQAAIAIRLLGDPAVPELENAAREHASSKVRQTVLGILAGIANVQKRTGATPTAAKALARLENATG